MPASIMNYELRRPDRPDIAHRADPDDEAAGVAMAQFIKGQLYLPPLERGRIDGKLYFCGMELAAGGVPVCDVWFGVGRILAETTFGGAMRWMPARTAQEMRQKVAAMNYDPAAPGLIVQVLDHADYFRMAARVLRRVRRHYNMVRRNRDEVFKPMLLKGYMTIDRGRRGGVWIGRTETTDKSWRLRQPSAR